MTFEIRDGADPITPGGAGPAGEVVTPPGVDGSDRHRDEQAYLDALYRRLDALRLDARARLDETLLARAGGSPQARTERDVFAATFAQRLARLDAVEDGLCFGRLDLAPGAEADPDPDPAAIGTATATADTAGDPDRPGEPDGRPGGARSEPVHIGRIGVSGTDQRILLVDWRAPAAEPFYRATAANPMGVRRRRHLRTRARRLTGFDDEIFDLTTLADGERQELTGEAALLAALAEARTGRMRDVVATLQAEQDRIVRSEARGVLVVAGGPGTGKTAVALHRAAYLLYTHAERLASSGVLLVGPSNAFLRYVEQVLPSLGETSVVLRTVAELVPGIEATGTEPEEVAAVKGDRRMAGVIAAAITERQRLPRRDLTLPYEGQPLRLPRGVCHDARRRARASRRPHNQARNIFVRTVLTHLSQQAIEVGLWEELDRGERDGLLRDLIRTPDIRWAVNRLWPHLTPEALLAQLYAEGGGGLTPRERRLLARSADSHWTPADVPLLDEAAELLGETDPWGRRAAQRAAARERAEEGYAAEV
ncbi:MAG: HelD family protein, partial [Frankia sp.]